MHCVQYIWNIDIMQARARRLERKMEEDQVRRALRYLTKYISKVEMVPRKQQISPYFQDRGLPALLLAGPTRMMIACSTNAPAAIRCPG